MCDTFIPIGASLNEDRTTSLTRTGEKLEESESKCPNCEEGYVFAPPANSSNWGTPSSPLSSYCRECNTKFVLGLISEEELEE